MTICWSGWICKRGQVVVLAMLVVILVMEILRKPVEKCIQVVSRNVGTCENL